VVARSRKTDLFSPSYYRCRNPVRNGSSLYPAPRVTSLSLRVLCYLLFKLFVFASFCQVVVRPAGKQTCSHPATTAAETQIGTDPRSTPLPALPPYPLVSFVTFCSNCLSSLPSVGSGCAPSRKNRPVLTQLLPEPKPSSERILALPHAPRFLPNPFVTFCSNCLSSLPSVGSGCAPSRKTDLFSPSYYRSRNPAGNGSSLYRTPRVSSLSLSVLYYLLFKLFVFASFCRKWLCTQPENRPVLTQLLPQPKPSWERILALPRSPRFLPIPWCPLLPSVQIVCLCFLLSEVVAVFLMRAQPKSRRCSGSRPVPTRNHIRPCKMEPAVHIPSHPLPIRAARTRR
jgi:hypothetical protein